MRGKRGSNVHSVKSRMGTAPLMWRCHMGEVLGIIMWQSCLKKLLRYVMNAVENSSLLMVNLETVKKCLMCTLGLCPIGLYCNHN